MRNLNRWLGIWALQAGLGLILLCGSVTAQDPELERSGVAGGFGFLTSERWGISSATIANPSNAEIELMTGISFPGDPDIANVQYAHRVWLPPKSKRTVAIPMRAPAVTGDKRSLEVEALLLTGRGDRQFSRQPGLMRIESRRPTFGVMSIDEASMNLATLMRESIGGESGIGYPNPTNLPRLTAAWQVMDCLLLARDTSEMDPVQVQAMRQWLVSGGRLWIMLDQVDESFARALLGDDYQVVTMGQTQVTNLEVDGQNILVDGAMTAPTEPRGKLPRGWTIPDGAAVEIHQGGTRIVSEDQGANVLIEHVMALEPGWTRVELAGVLRSQNLTVTAGEGHGAVVRATFLDAAGEPMGKPTVLALTKNQPRASKPMTAKLDVPTGGVSIRFESGLVQSKGTMWVSGVSLRPLSVSMETPATMLRVVASNVEILRSIDGWPAAFSRQVGRGEVMITTVSADLWLAEAAAGYKTMDEIARVFVRRRDVEPLTSMQMMPFVKEEIGRRIVPRTPVMLMLLVLPVVMLVAGVALLRRNRLELVAPVSVLCSLGLGGALMMVGMANRHETPLTLATAQFVDVVPSQGQANVQGLVSVYSPVSEMGPLSAKAGGVVWPDRTGQEGKLLRMVWTDMDHWMWDNLALPSGAVRTAELDHVAALDQPAEVRVSFDERGAVVRLAPGPFTGFEAPVLAGPNAHMVPQVTGEGVMVAGLGQYAAAGQFIAGGTLTEVQQRRQEIYRELLKPTEISFNRVRYPRVPTLLWWANPMDLGFGLPQQFERREWALIGVPVRFERPASGTRVFIPGPLIPYESDRGPSRFSAATVYNNFTGEWLGQMTQGMSIPMRFDLPAALMPLTITRMTLSVDIRGSGRSLEVLDARRGEVIATESDLSRVVTFDLTSVAGAAPDEQGRVYVILRVSEMPDVTQTQTWTIHGLSMEVEANVP